MANRIIALVALAAVSALALEWWFSSRDVGPIATGSEPDLYMLRARIEQFDANGNLQHRIQAERFSHLPVTDVTEMDTPFVSLPRAAERPAWDIAAKRGRILPPTGSQGQVVELLDDVSAATIRTDGGELRILTQALTVYPDQERAETDQQVRIEKRAGTTVAAGLRADFDKGDIEFLSNAEQRVTSELRPDVPER